MRSRPEGSCMHVCGAKTATGSGANGITIRGEQNQKWPTCGQIGFTTPCHLGGPQRFKVGDKIRSGPHVGRLATQVCIFFCGKHEYKKTVKTCKFFCGKREHKKLSRRVILFFAVNASTKKMSHCATFFCNKCEYSLLAITAKKLHNVTIFLLHVFTAKSAK